MPGCIPSTLPKAALLLTLLVLGTLATGPVLGQPLSKILPPPGYKHWSDSCDFKILPHGNIVVIDSEAELLDGTYTGGAVHLYDGRTLQIISTLTGGPNAHGIGSSEVYVVKGGNFVVCSPEWDDYAGHAGAATWIDGKTGLNGVISFSNSLIGTDSSGVIVLSDGDYVVRNPFWKNGSIENAGAVMWVDGSKGATGPISAANCLVGTQTNDYVGLGVHPLKNGNYVVRSNEWNNGAIAKAGAVTWGNGATGTKGVVSSANSLVGTHYLDQVGLNYTQTGLVELTNGNYVISSVQWGGSVELSESVNSRGPGAVTWCNGTSPTTGAVSASNSLVGTQETDMVGIETIALTNGHYVARNTLWDNGSITNAGAVTWGNGTTGTKGIVSAANSLVGTHANDFVGIVVPLTNGNYVVACKQWDGPAGIDQGSVTWGNGASGTAGAVSSANSLVGTKAGDKLSSGGVVPLTNGNYVVCSPDLSRGNLQRAGAATFGNGTSGIQGEVSPQNSLLGTHASESIADSAVALTNGSYVVISSNYQQVAPVYTGSFTWGSGTVGVTGDMTETNSLFCGADTKLSVVPLTNGNYLAVSPQWKKGDTVMGGAVTWGSGTTGITGTVSEANSIVGDEDDYSIGIPGILALANGNYVVGSRLDMDSRAAATWGNGSVGTTGLITESNSLMNPGSASLELFSLEDGHYAVRAAMQPWRLQACDGFEATTGLIEGSPLNGTVFGYFEGHPIFEDDTRNCRLITKYVLTSEYNHLEILLVPCSRGIEILNSNEGLVTLDAAEIAMGAVRRSDSQQSKFTVRNKGGLRLDLTNVTVSGAGALDFDVSLTSGNLAGGEEREFTVVFTPSALGSRTAVLTIANNDPVRPSVSITLNGTGVHENTPVFTIHPASSLVMLGEPASFTAAATAAPPPTFAWSRSGTSLGGQTGAPGTLSLPACQALDAGAYVATAMSSGITNSSNPAHLGVITPPPAMVLSKKSVTLFLACKVAAPAGATVQHAWSFKGTPLTNVGRIQAAQTDTLKVLGLQPEDEGVYTCLVTMTLADGTVFTRTTTTEVLIPLKPEFLGGTLPDLFVGEDLVEPAEGLLSQYFKNPATTISATGLPTGITLDAKTGRLAGRPTKTQATPFKVTVTAGNVAGSAVGTLLWKVLPLPAEFTSSYAGLIERSEAINQSLGGAFALSLTNLGSFTGSLRLGAKTIPCKGTAKVRRGAGGAASPYFEMVVPGTAAQPQLTFALSFEAAGPGMQPVFTLMAPQISQQAAVTGWRCRTSGAGFEATHNARLSPGSLADDVRFPQGHGFGTVKIAKTAAITFALVLADGTAVNGSSTLGANGEAGLYAPLYTNTGSFKCALTVAGAESVAGQGDWMKNTQKPTSTTRTYKTGIPAGTVLITGRPFRKPATGKNILNADLAAGSDAILNFEETGSTLTDFTQTCTLSPTNTLIIPTSNANKVKATLNTTTGKLTGSFVLSQSHPLPGGLPAQIVRTVTFQGLVVQESSATGDSGAAFGYFLIPLLPATASESTTKNTAIASGAVFLEAATPAP